MKICLIYDFLTEYGGIERLIVNHAKILRESGFDVEILTCHINKEVIEKMNLSREKIINISLIKTPFESISLATSYLGLNKLDKLKADAFLSYSFPSSFMIRNKKAIKINYVNHFPHFLYFKGKNKKEWATSTYGIKRKISIILSWLFGPWLKNMDIKLIKNSILNFVNSNFTKKGLEKLYKTNMVLNYPVLDPVFKPSKNKLNEKFIFTSGRIIASKKFEWVIEACSLMKNKMPLYISGQGDKTYQKNLLDLARKLKVDLKFLGRLDTGELIKYYTSAQVSAFPIPKFEFGLVPVESIACGTPVIVWGDNGGQCEIIINGVNGYHAKPYDRKDFAHKMDKIIDSKFKAKNKRKIILSSRKFSYKKLKENFIAEINKLF